MKTSRPWMISACVAASLWLANMASAQEPAKPAAPAEPAKPAAPAEPAKPATNAAPTKGEAVLASVEVTAEVTKIDQKTREVTLKTQDGKEYSFVADEAVKNLAQVNKGDLVTVTYTEALAYEVHKSGKATAVEATATAKTAEPGAKPAGVIGQKVKVTVAIAAIDSKVPSVTFKGPGGNTRTIKVQHPEKLEGVNVGDMVDLTYTEAIAVKVEKAPKK